MRKYIAILRGINVSGQKKIKMADLKEYCSELEIMDITTYIQSGNILFRSAIESKEELARQIKEKIYEKYGFEVPVLILEMQELKAIRDADPYTGREEAEGRCYITFLFETPQPADISTLEEQEHSPDEFIISGKVIYLYVPSGYGKTKITNNFFEKKLKVPASTRNRRTVNKLVEMAQNL